MAKVTSKLQVTIPKRLATRFGISPGDGSQTDRRSSQVQESELSNGQRLALFDAATERQEKRNRSANPTSEQCDP